MIQVCLQRLELKGFRCFKTASFDFDGSLILIQGSNGSGKTSLLEALHYLCYLRSFRTHSPRELTHFESEGFFIKAVFDDQEIRIGCAKNKRHVRINQKPINSYQDLRQFYRVVTVTEDDLNIVKGSPEKRRSFLDHALLLDKPENLSLFKAFKKILENRNALLQQHGFDMQELEIWTQKLWESTQEIQEHRKSFIAKLQASCSQYLKTQWDNHYTISFCYSAKKQDQEDFNEFLTHWREKIYQEERRYKRSLFGAHLDDFHIKFQGKPARFFSSRGQQKLIVLLVKMAQVTMLLEQQGNTCFLLDDFMTDFDDQVMSKIISACIKLKTQLIFTSPTEGGVDSALLKERNAQVIKLSM